MSVSTYYILVYSSVAKRGSTRSYSLPIDPIIYIKKAN